MRIYIFAILIHTQESKISATKGLFNYMKTKIKKNKQEFYCHNIFKIFNEKNIFKLHSDGREKNIIIILFRI